MEETKEMKKTKSKHSQWRIVVLFMVIGAVCGLAMAAYMLKMEEAGASDFEVLMQAFVLLMGMYAAMVVQIIVHEAGHLVFGLLSGYEFNSFRIFSFMWIKKDGKLQCKRFSLAGTGGQCLMNPPDMADGKMPFALYNMGGSILNVAAAAVFWILSLLTKGIPMLSYICIIFAVVGLGFAIINGVPMHAGPADNDGYNAVSLGKNPAALRSFWIQMKASGLQALGVRLRDMPEEWFELPAEEDMKNASAASIAVFAVSRLMDEHRYEEADAMMERLLGMESGIVDLHRNMMIAERMYLELIGENRREVLEKLYNKEQKKFMKTMKTYLSIIRTEYAYALLCEGDEAKAAKIKERFEKAASTYPYEGDLEGEREYVELAEKKYGERKF